MSSDGPPFPAGAKTWVDLYERRVRFAVHAAIQLCAKFPSMGPFLLTYALAVEIIRGYLGHSWILTHILSGPDPTGFFRNQWQTAPERDDNDMRIGVSRLNSLAEMLLNMAHVPGFSGVRRRMASGDIEPTFTELEVGKNLCFIEKPFRYVETSGVPKADYDIEFLHLGYLVCADAKCKLEETRKSENSVLHSLKQARTQLPDNKPGVIFLKVPYTWINESNLDGFDDFMAIVTERFFLGHKSYRGTCQVVCVSAYTSLIHFIPDEAIMPIGWMKDFVNPRHRFHSTVDWSITRKGNLRAPIKAPPYWCDLGKIIREVFPEDPDIQRAKEAERRRDNALQQALSTLPPAAKAQR